MTACKPCPTCQGTGRIRDADPRNIFHTVVCDICSGSGEIYSGNDFLDNELARNRAAELPGTGNAIEVDRRGAAA